MEYKIPLLGHWRMYFSIPQHSLIQTIRTKNEMKNMFLYYLKNDTHEIYTNMQEQDLIISKQKEIQI